MRRLVPILALVVLVAAPGARADDAVARAAAVLREDDNRVYVDPAASQILPRADAQYVEGEIRALGGAPIYVAVLPGVATSALGDVELRELQRRIGGKGIFATVVGGRLRAHSNVLREGLAERLASQARATYEDNGLKETLLGFIKAAGQEQGDLQRGTRTARVLAIVVAAVFAVVALLALGRRRRNWSELARLRPEAEQELTEIRRRLDVIESEEVRSQLRAAERALTYARKPADLERVNDAIDRARRAAGLS